MPNAHLPLLLGFACLALAACGTGSPSKGVQACLRACGDGCPAPVGQPCASDGRRYCNECVITCYGLSVAPPETCAPLGDVQEDPLEGDDPPPEEPDSDPVDTVEDEGTQPVDAAPDTPSEDADVADVSACLDQCPVGCPSPEHWPCASDGQTYCNACVIGCYGLELADDAVCRPWVTCLPPADASPVPYRVWRLPENCWDADEGWLPDEVFHDEASFRATLRCEGEPTIGVDFERERVVRAIVRENPVVEVRGVVRGDAAGDVALYLSSPAYCGGAAPPSSMVFVVLGAGQGAVDVRACLYGTCDWGEFPPP